MSGVVTISASFGASGEVIGRAVSRELGLPFFDRAVPAAVAQRLSVPIEDALGHDDKAPSALDRLAASFAGASVPFGPAGLAVGVENSEVFRRETERILHTIANTSGGVILGRAGMVVLRERRDVLRVRLDGPVEDRIAHTMRTQGLSEAAARELQRDIDAAREAYARVFYRARQTDPDLYQVMLEPTSLGIEVCTAAIVQIARVHLAEPFTSPVERTGDSA